MLVEDVGGHDEDRFLSCQSRHPCLIHRQGRGHRPDRLIGRGLFFGATTLLILLLFFEREASQQPGWFAFECLFPGGARIRFADTVFKTLPAYRAYLASGQYSQYTPDDFKSDMTKFGSFVAGKALRDIQTADLQQWIGDLKKTMTAKTVSRKVSALTNYFRWLEQTQVLTANPARAIPYLKVTAPLPDILYEGECRALRAAASHDPRAYLLILLLLETGLKKAELLALKRAHFDLSDIYAPELWVKHTGKHAYKDRKLKLPPKIVLALDDYKRQYGTDDTTQIRAKRTHKPATDNLFPYTPRFIEMVLADTARQAGVDKQVTASMLRDTFAMRRRKQGEKIEDVRRKMGLSDKHWKDARRKYERLAAAAI